MNSLSKELSDFNATNIAGDVVEHTDGSLSVIVFLDPGCEQMMKFHFKSIEHIRSFELNAVVSVICEDGVGKKKWAFSGRLNLYSTSGRGDFARQIRLAGNIKDFAAERGLSAAIEAISSHLSSKDNSSWIEDGIVEDQPYLFNPWLRDNAAHILFGMGSSGKSYISLRIALSLITGVPFLDRRPEKKVKVLYIDYEASKADLRTRLYRLMASRELHDKAEAIIEKIRYARVFQPLKDIRDSIYKIIKREEIGFVIIDSVVPACGGEPERADIAGGYFNTLSSLEIPTLSIAHETKTENHSYPFGSIFFHNLSRMTWNIQAEHDDMDSRITEVGLFHRKSNDGPLHKPIAIKIFHGDGFTDIGHGDINIWKEDWTLSDRICDILSEGMKSKNMIEEELPDVPKNSVKVSLARLVKKGTVTLLGGKGGEYKLAKRTE